MSLVAIIALAASSTTLPHCSWDRPGVNPFMGDLVAAVDRYKDIPAATRTKLKARMQTRQYDEIVDIRRDSITGRYDYDAGIRDMHFGAGSVCASVTRTQWTERTLERGLVYCEDGQCILVPTVCRNVSRITRGDRKPGGIAQTAAKDDDATPLMFEPPAAGATDAVAADPGSFARTASVPTPTAFGDSLISGPGFSSGGSAAAPPGGAGLVMLPPSQQIPQGGGNGGGVTPISPAPAVPEPQSWLLFAIGLAGLTVLARRRA